MKNRRTPTTGLRLMAMLALWLLAANQAGAWWDASWTGRTKLTIDPAAEGAQLNGAPGDAVVLVRLHPGNLPFDAIQSDGSDLRFVAGDDKTLLPFHLEKLDTLMAEGFAWVRVPAIKGDAPTDVWLYYGNASPGAEGAADPLKTYAGSEKIVYHLNERGTPPQDSTSNKANAETAGNLSEGTVVADGLRLVGRDPIKIPGSPANAWTAGGDLTFLCWVKPVTTSNEAIIFTRPGAGSLTIGLAAGGAPFVEVAGVPRAIAAESIGAGAWKQVALAVTGGKMTLYVDGREATTLAAPLPASDGPMFLGGPDPSQTTEQRLVGEFDEFQMHAAALSPATLRLLYITQSGTELAGNLIKAAETEGGDGGGHEGMLAHLSLFGDIASNMMFDGWIAIVICAIMMIAGWSVAIAKFIRLRSLIKGDNEFLKQWGEVSADLTVLDADEPDSLTNLRMEALQAKGKTRETAKIRAMLNSPIYHLYHLGIKEIRHRITSPERHQGLSVRSIQAIRAALDAGMVRERHRLNKGLVYLTISIAGGPYVGLLGTVVGVMITFAVIARSGEVDVNSIAPGIASALLATTVGLLVAIPALFMYSFLSTSIKDVIGLMQVFIDEFVTKIAEAYPPPGEGLPPRYNPANDEPSATAANLT
ncbi:MAG: DUF2341 domain-containing protein [Chthoniobacterales bacterium]